MKNFLIRLKVVPFIILAVAVFTGLFCIFEEPVMILLNQKTLQGLAETIVPKEDMQSVNHKGSAIEVAVVPDGKGQIDINKATAGEFDSLPGIGFVRANAIVEQRNKMNGFTTLEDIMCTEGVGEGVFEKILPYIKILPLENTQK